MAMDRSGTSDPYIKILQGGKLLHKSRSIKRTLDPVWDEEIDLYLDLPLLPLCLKVYDKDAIISDDFMGEVGLHIHTFAPDDSFHLDLELEDGGDSVLMKKKKLGSIEIMFSYDFISQSQYNQVSVRKCFQCSVFVSQLMEDDHNSEVSLKKSSRSVDWSVRDHSAGRVGQVEKSKVHVMVVEADGLKSTDRNSVGIDPFCKLSIGKEKAKTKIIERSNSPVWKEAVSLAWVEGYSTLTIQILDWKTAGLSLDCRNEGFKTPSQERAWVGWRWTYQS